MNYNDERVKKEEEDYYAGYYWGRNSYDSECLSTEKTDDNLKKRVLQNLQRSGTYLDAVKVSVHSGLILLEGKIGTYKERRHIGSLVWNTAGVSMVLNLLTVTNPKTIGPARNR
jgi:osmotically-inducible protein OsmY